MNPVKKLSLFLKKEYLFLKKGLEDEYLRPQAILLIIQMIGIVISITIVVLQVITAYCNYKAKTAL